MPRYQLMTRSQKITAFSTLGGVFGIPLLIWLVSWHLALASTEDLANLALASSSDLTSAVKAIQKEQRGNRRRDLFKDNNRDLIDVDFKLYELDRNLDHANEAQAQLIQTFKATKAQLLLDQTCIIQTGRECLEDVPE